MVYDCIFPAHLKFPGPAWWCQHSALYEINSGQWDSLGGLLYLPLQLALCCPHLSLCIHICFFMGGGLPSSLLVLLDDLTVSCGLQGCRNGLHAKLGLGCREPRPGRGRWPWWWRWRRMEGRGWRWKGRDRHHIYTSQSVLLHKSPWPISSTFVTGRARLLFSIYLYILFLFCFTLAARPLLWVMKFLRWAASQSTSPLSRPREKLRHPLPCMNTFSANNINLWCNWPVLPQQRVLCVQTHNGEIHSPKLTIQWCNLMTWLCK